MFRDLCDMVLYNNIILYLKGMHKIVFNYNI